ncbi:hypothetical protein CYLTODRAFT_363339, partial [Cylindrobasidium torrendii FP15055 ss-10]
IISLPNLCIIDFGYGHTGSTHNATAWEGTCLAQNHKDFLKDGEWIWADSAYLIRNWIVSPYKKPDRYEPNNDTFNKQVLALHIRSEHAIRFLKGCFHSLKNLCQLRIQDAKSHCLATYWVLGCIAIHACAMECEAKEGGNDFDTDDNPFVDEGMDEDSDMDVEEEPIGPARNGARGSTARLRAGREKQETLKQKLLRHKTWCAQCREMCHLRNLQ